MLRIPLSLSPRLGWLMLALPLLAHAADNDLDDLRQVRAYNDWQIVHQDNLHNIRTYVKQEDGKRVRSFKIEVQVDASMQAVARVYLDPDNYKRWFFDIHPPLLPYGSLPSGGKEGHSYGVQTRA